MNDRDPPDQSIHRMDEETIMSKLYCYDHPRPAVTVDLVIFALLEGSWRVLLIRRGRDPFAGRWAVPGGFLDMDETGAEAARRELKEETGLNEVGPITFLGVYDDPHRDPRGRTISLTYVAALKGPPPKVEGGDDAVEAAWVDVGTSQSLGLAFDHARVLSDAIGWLGNIRVM